MKECDLNLEIAKELKPLLEANGIEVIMTRTTNSDVSLQERCNIANNAKADLLVSIHVNAGSGTGVEVLIIGTGGRAEVAAKKMLPYLVDAGQWRNRGVKVQNVYVLRETTAPAILTENGFIDTVGDATKLHSITFRKALAVAHAKGICEYFGRNYKEPTPPANVVADKDIYLSVRVLESKAEQAIIDINQLGFAAKRLELA
jgi:N-acetylmuramoyl-L-alanine amidase